MFTKLENRIVGFILIGFRVFVSDQHIYIALLVPCEFVSGEFHRDLWDILMCFSNFSATW